MSEAEPTDIIWPEKKPMDSAWVHGRVVERGNYRKVQCIYCSQVITSSITGLKKHLARIGGSVRPCPRVPRPVANGFRNNFEEAPFTYTLTLKRKQMDVPLYRNHSHNPKYAITNGEAAEKQGERAPGHNLKHVNTNYGMAKKQGEHSHGRGKAGSLLAMKGAGSGEKDAGLVNAGADKKGFGTHKRDDDVIGMCTSKTQGAPKEGRVNDAYDPKQNSPVRAKLSLQKLLSRMCKDSASISKRLEFEGLKSNETNPNVVKNVEEILSFRNDVLKVKSEVAQLENRWSIICDKLKK